MQKLGCLLSHLCSREKAKFPENNSILINYFAHYLEVLDSNVGANTHIRHFEHFDQTVLSVCNKLEYLNLQYILIS